MGVFNVIRQIKKIGCLINDQIIPTSNNQNRKIMAVAIDMESLVGKYYKFHTTADTKQPLFIKRILEIIIGKYLQPLIQNNIYFISLIGSNDTDDLTGVSGDQDTFKLFKNILKAYYNQSAKMKLKQLMEYCDFFTDYHRKSEYVKYTDEQINMEISRKMEISKKIKLNLVSDITELNLTFDDIKDTAIYHWEHRDTFKKDMYRKIINYIGDYIRYLGFPVIKKNGDVDKWCALLYHSGIVDFVISRDSDMLAMKTNIITDINVCNDTFSIKYIQYSDFRNKYIDYTDDEIHDGLALSSADYNFLLFNQKIPFYDAVEKIKSVGYDAAFDYYFNKDCFNSFNPVNPNKSSETYSLAKLGIRSCYDLCLFEIQHIVNDLLTAFQSPQKCNYKSDLISLHAIKQNNNIEHKKNNILDNIFFIDSVISDNQNNIIRLHNFEQVLLIQILLQQSTDIDPIDFFPDVLNNISADFQIIEA